MDKQLSLHKILLSLVGFVLLWAIVTDAWGYSDLFFGFEAGCYIYAYLSRLIWVSPAICLILKFSGFLQTEKKELFSSPHFNNSLLGVLIVSFSFVLVSMLIDHKGFWVNRETDVILTIIKFIIVGFVEETVFRGWGFNALQKVISEKKAAILSTIFFVALHWPAYFIKLFRFGVFDYTGLLNQRLSALIWGLIFCWLLKRGKSLWHPIIAHAFYDSMMVFFVG